MRLYKRGSMYWFELEFKGERYQRSTKSKNERVANQVMSAFHTALVKGEVGITDRQPVPKLGEAMKAFLAWSTLEHRSHPETTVRYEYSSEPLLKFFGTNTPLDKITPERADEYKQKRSRQKSKTGKRYAPATVNRELACLRLMFNHAIKGNRDLQNPISKQTGVKLLAEDNQQERVLSYTEEEKYLAAATPALRDVATMIVESGMRPEEVFELTAAAVNLESNSLRVLRSKTKAGRRQIELTPAMRTVLEPRLQKTKVGYLFPNERDPKRPMPGMQSPHARALRDSKVLPFRPYDLRHTFATRAAQAGVDLVTLAALLGHSRIQMVMRYAHPTQAHQTGAMTRVLEHKANQRAWEKARAEQEQRDQQEQSAPGPRLVAKSA